MANEDDEERTTAQPGVNSEQNTPIAGNPAQGDEIATPADPPASETPSNED